MMKVGFWQRVLALTIDEILLVGVTALALARLNRFDIFHAWWIRILFYELIDYNYYTLCWRFGGQTVGKRIMRAKVVRMDGRPLSYWDAVVRYWVWMVGMALAGIGYFWIAWDREKRGWNDHVAKTRVVRV
jgi:uncharacterized RDD family membrane protein YckC